MDNEQRLKNQGEYEPDIPEDIVELMVKNNLTRAQAEDVLERRKKFEAEMAERKKNWLDDLKPGPKSI